MNYKDYIDLPINFDCRIHEGLMNVWWTATMLKKKSKRFFHPKLSSESQFNILMAIQYADGNLTQNELSKRLLVDKSNITGLIDRLEKLDLLFRAKIANDRRSYHIKLTKKGSKLILNLEEKYLELVYKIMSELDKDDVEQLIKLTRKIRMGLAKE